MAAATEAAIGCWSGAVLPLDLSSSRVNGQWRRVARLAGTGQSTKLAGEDQTLLATRTRTWTSTYQL